MLSDEEKRELLRAAKSIKLRKEFRKLSENRTNPFMVNGKVDMDRLLEFLTEYNKFISHRPKPFREIADGKMRL